MRDAWIYTEDGRLASSLSRNLAELGFRPRRVVAGGSLMPDEGVRRPALVVVAAGPDEEAPCDLAQRLREHDELGEVPLVAALEAGHLPAPRTLDAVDELLVLPYCPAEMGARVARARRRINGVEDGDVVRVGSLEINVATYQVTIDGQPVSFAYMEYELLRFLVTHPNRVFSRESLLSAVWGYDYYGGART
ncbi:MAG TPA: winged helix-turn-helix domain-containing protein, partial [Solirubrobacteraceae bacterium]|nr:winged helix-turn-helix domain-containing protein [Solirubrobacteraceae bacterium]